MILPSTSAPNTPKLDSGFPKDLESSGTTSGSSSPPNERKESLHEWANHPENPFNWPESKKWRTALTASAVVLLIGLNCTAIATPAHVITARFNVNDTGFPNDVWPITAWCVSAFQNAGWHHLSLYRNTGAALGPMVGMPLLESFGIRKGYIVSQ